MELQEVVKNFAEQFEDTDPAEIHVDTVFHDLEEWSSLTALGVIACVKTTYDKTINGKEIRSCVTVKDLYDLVASK